MTDAFDQPDRLETLEELGLLTDTPQEGLDRYTRLAALIVEAPVTLFTVVVGDTQYFRSQVGLQEPYASRRQTPRSHSFCQYVVLSGKPLEVVDAREHPTVRDNPAIEDLGVVAYLGMPVVTRKGECVGSLCAFEHEPREWTPRERAALKDLAGAATTELELRRATREAMSLARRLDEALRERR